MATTHYRRRAPAAHGITAAALEAFKAGNRKTLHHELRLQPWASSPLDAQGACPWPASCAGAVAWPKAVELRELLEAVQ